MQIYPEKECPECGVPMVIDNWDGWRWVCLSCDYVDDSYAEEEDVQKHEEYINFELSKKGENFE